LVDNNNRAFVRFWSNEIQINEKIIEKNFENHNL
jgi:hypothetical protein